MKLIKLDKEPKFEPFTIEFDDEYEVQELIAILGKFKASIKTTYKLYNLLKYALSDMGTEKSSRYDSDDVREMIPR